MAVHSFIILICFVSCVIIAYPTSQLSASCSSLCTDCNLPSDFVNKHVNSPVWFMVWCWLLSQTQLASV